jgi:hypothetical protein
VDQSDPDVDAYSDADADADAGQLVARRLIAPRLVACRRPAVVESVGPALVVRARMAGPAAPGFAPLASRAALSPRPDHSR